MSRTDLASTRTENTGPSTDRVRIVGAEPAGEATGELPAVTDDLPADDLAADDPSAGSAPATGPHRELFEDADPTTGLPTVRVTDERAAPVGSSHVVAPVTPGQTAVPASLAAEGPTAPAGPAAQADAPSGAGGDEPAATPLPHWTEPPTGQVPAVLSRDDGGEGRGPAGPNWREDDADWEAHEEQFAPAMLVVDDDEAAIGSLDESNRTAAERRPWEFDLDPAGEPHDPGDHITEPVQVVGPPEAEDVPRGGPTGEPTRILPAPSDPPARSGEPTRAVPAQPSAGRPTGRPAGTPPGTGVTGAGATAGSVDDPLAFLSETSDPASSVDPSEPTPGGPGAPGSADDILFAERRRPSGVTRVGRARRNGLRPARVRAKRPDDVDALTDAPLAAEPPGASVADVPGAGRRRGGMAGLAAADRGAGRGGEDGPGDDPGTTPPEGDDRQPGLLRRHLGGAFASSGRTAAPAPSDLSEPSNPSGPTVASDPAGPPAAPTRPAPLDAPVPSDRRGSGDGRPDRPSGRPPLDPLVGPGRGAALSGRPVEAGAGEGPGASMPLRVGTGVAAAVIALLAFKLGTVTSLILCAVVVTFAAGECFGALRSRGHRPAALLGLAGTVALMVGAYNKGIAAVPLVLALISAFTLLWYLIGAERGPAVAGTATTLFTVGWVSLFGAYAGLLLAPSTFPDRHGIAFLLGAVIATVANDVGALLIGGWLGSRALAPTISPNKTWEGLLGGAVCSILASTLIVGAIHPWSASSAALLGVVVAVVAPLGDLCESMLKRDLGLKDMGTLLPGHGGVLDRVDALLFVLPATYYLVRALNIS